MKLIDLHSIRHGGLAAISLAALAIPALADDVTVDGVRDNSGPEGYTLLHTQTTQSNWGGPSGAMTDRCSPEIRARRDRRQRTG